MKTRKRNLKILFWLPALLLTATDAYAWGLYTHVWFAQSLLWLVPLADTRIRDAARKFPRLVMAGACLPDLALVRDLVGSTHFADSHDWEMAAMQLERARADDASDEARAIALGYASHLLSDIFAHNHFVPAHENVWADVPVLTHASCEWALDYHVRRELFATPGAVLTSERAVLCAYLQDAFGCTPGEARRLLIALANGDRLLRGAGLPALAYAIGRRADKRMLRRFNHYLDQTVKRLPQINGLIAGERPQWDANPPRHLAHIAIAEASMPELRSRLALPSDVFQVEG
ncbi:MAG TPA: zinc dependent phospholipase C family protein [Rhodocyclaceae bacterium]|jgi:hypothetical protein|nr:zinc dependent phospholipase C family protein [Rhodocyclaceae bacterium]